MKRILTLALPFLSVFAVVLVGEGVVRTYHFLRWDISILDGKPRHPERPSSNSLSPITLDPTLGWRATENYRFDGIKHNTDGTEYAAKVSQDSRGFRMFGDLSSGKRRILVIGDSFTEAIYASDDKTYFATLKESLNAEVFAYGAGGYGSLQEYMILDKHIDSINPDLLLWQFSLNDIVNNSPDLETASTSNNNGMTRPYWIDKEVRYILPARDSAGVRRFALEYCRMCYLILNRVDRLGAATRQSVETQTAVGEPAHALFLQALQTTDEIMKRVKARIGSIPIAAFIVGDPGKTEYWEGLEEICRRNAIILLPDVNAAVESAEKAGAVVRGADNTHWNHTGHQIAGEKVVEGLRRNATLLARHP